LGYVWGKVIFWSSKLHYSLTKEVYGKGQSVIVSVHCINKAFVYANSSSFGGLEDVCWPLVLKFAGSNPAKAFRFFGAKKSPARLPSEGK
jgi:hypothetical protein